jgi:hypothetical protein
LSSPRAAAAKEHPKHQEHSEQKPGGSHPTGIEAHARELDAGIASAQIRYPADGQLAGLRALATEVLEFVQAHA